jgi:hydrogenase maturation protease
LDSFSDGSISAHGWGVAETLALGHKLIPTSMPKKLTLIGIEAGNILMGESLSPGVELALPEAAHLIEQLVSMR